MFFCTGNITPVPAANNALTREKLSMQVWNEVMEVAEPGNLRHYCIKADSHLLKQQIKRDTEAMTNKSINRFAGPMSL
ncbi:hypothetical protein ABBQ38_010032 [Trebouxia sp. C0009 RCD-2024]